MKPEIKEKWIAALLSDDYQQGTGVLHKGDKFCCLGVLCDLYLKEHDAEWEEKEETGAGTYNYYCLDWDEVPPPAVQEWAGLEENDPIVGGNKPSISFYNDYKQLSFREIAGIIEEKM